MWIAVMVFVIAAGLALALDVWYVPDREWTELELRRRMMSRDPQIPPPRKLG